MQINSVQFSSQEGLWNMVSVDCHDDSTVSRLSLQQYSQ